MNGREQIAREVKQEMIQSMIACFNQEKERKLANYRQRARPCGETEVVSCRIKT